MKCTFCPNDLDNSDEHIILNCLNGKLHSKKIVCTKCNNFFGAQLDSVAKKFFNPILLVLEFKNASSEIAENMEGEDDYLIKKGGEVLHRKPRIIERKIEGKTLLSISGDRKNVLKYFEKYSKRLEEKGGKTLASKVEEVNNSSPLRIKADFKTNSDINLLLNKIAIEYCAYKKVNNQAINDLADRVIKLDDSLNNIFYCNLKEEIREFNSGEITHFIKLWTNGGKIYVYIELFNIICAVLVISNDYEGLDFEFQYYQDCISGEKLTDILEINQLEIEKAIQNQSNEANLAELANKLFFRKREKDFRETFNLMLADIKERLEKKLADGEITKSEFSKMFIHESTKFIAKLQIENPYMFDDIDDANNDELNYIHSNLRENQFDDFCENCKPIIGEEVKIDGDRLYLIKRIPRGLPRVV